MKPIEASSSCYGMVGQPNARGRTKKCASQAGAVLSYQVESKAHGKTSVTSRSNRPSRWG